MAKYERRTWHGDLGGYTRADRKSGSYMAYVPDALMGRAFLFGGEVAAEMADAEQAIAELDGMARVLSDTEALARLLLRAESVASSRIEGLEMSARRLLRAEVQRHDGEGETVDVTAGEIIGNIDAMAHIVSTTTRGDTITVEDILLVHKKMMAGTRQEKIGGTIRTAQNWIGGSDFHPLRAHFVPPPPEQVKALLMDLVAFCNQGNLPPIAQAAVAHAQFETIHPFVDGNGRTGRALIHMILRRRGSVNRIVPPISLILATRSRDYISGLQATRYEGAADTASAQEGVAEWVSTFSRSCKQAVENSMAFERRMQSIKSKWEQRLGKVRANSTSEALLSAALAAPVMTVKSASAYLQRSFTRTNEAILRFVEAGILKPAFVGKRRNRVFEAEDALDAFRDLERQMASPLNDTRIAGPARPVARKKNSP